MLVNPIEVGRISQVFIKAYVPRDTTCNRGPFRALIETPKQGVLGIFRIQNQRDNFFSPFSFIFHPLSNNIYVGHLKQLFNELSGLKLFTVNFMSYKIYFK